MIGAAKSFVNTGLAPPSLPAQDRILGSADFQFCCIADLQSAGAGIPPFGLKAKGLRIANPR